MALAVFLMRIDRRGVLRPGYLVGLWVFGYGLGRLWVEALRVDQASLIVGVRVNTWMALAAIVVGAVVTWTGRATRSPADAGNDRITT